MEKKQVSQRAFTHAYPTKQVPATLHIAFKNARYLEKNTKKNYIEVIT